MPPVGGGVAGGNAQADGKASVWWVHVCWATFNNRTQRGSAQRGLVRFLPVCDASSSVLAAGPGAGLLSKFFYSVKEKVNDSF